MTGTPRDDVPLLLAGDVGGNRTNLALFSAAGGAPVILAERGFQNDDFASLAAVVEAFTRHTGRAPRAACFGIAGPVAGGRARRGAGRQGRDHALARRRTMTASRSRRPSCRPTSRAWASRWPRRRARTASTSTSWTATSFPT